MAHNSDGSQRRPLQQSLTESRQRNPRVNNEPAIISDSFFYSTAAPPPRRITRSQSHATHSMEFYALAESSYSLDATQKSVETISESLSSSTDSGLLDFTPENSVSPMHDPDFDIEADSDSSQLQPEETSHNWNPPHAPFDDRFLRHQGRLNYHQLRQREIFENRYVKMGISDTLAVLALITGTGLMNTVTNVGTFPREVILEFYANFGGTLDSRVFVRGSMFEFSPQSINRVYKTPDVEHHPVSECDRVCLSKHILAKHLSEGRYIHWCSPFSPQVMPRYLATLFRISCYNWIPTKNISDVSIECMKLLFMIDQRMKFNFGKLVYDQIARVARSPGHLNEIIPFANLIYNVLTSQKSPRLANDKYAEMLLPRQMFDASLHPYGYTPSPDPQSSSTNNAKSLSDDLRVQAQELDNQGNELHMRAMQLRTMAAKMDGGQNEPSSS